MPGGFGYYNKFRKQTNVLFFSLYCYPNRGVSMKRIKVVEDDEALREEIYILLERNGFIPVK